MKQIYAIFAICLFSHMLSAQEKRNLSIPQLEKAPNIDGKIDEPLWQDAAKTGDFITITPVFGQKTPYSTEVRMFFTNEALYIAARCQLSAGGLRSDRSERDNTSSGDWFRVGLDTWKDGQNAFIFTVTAGGALIDYNTGTSYTDANYFWQSAVSEEADAWVLEMRIPFTSLRFPNNVDQHWGLQFSRFDRSSGQLSSWNPQDPNITDEVLQYGTLEGLGNIKQLRRLSGAVYSQTEVSNGPKSIFTPYRNLLSETLAADVKVGINSASTLDFSIIPGVRYRWLNSILKSQLESPDLVSGQYNNFSRNWFNEAPGPFGTSGAATLPNMLSNAFIERANVPDGSVYYNLSGGGPIGAAQYTTRTKNGLSLGAYNAVMSQVDAAFYYLLPDGTTNTLNSKVQNLSNYNVLAAEKTLTNNGYINLSTATLLAGPGVNSNNSTLKFRLRDRSNRYQFQGLQSLSYNHLGNAGALTGTAYNYGFARVNSRLGWGINHSGNTHHFLNYPLPYYYNNSDQKRNTSSAYVSWNDYRPNRFFQNKRATLGLSQNWNVESMPRTTLALYALNKNFESFGLQLWLNPNRSVQDYFFQNNKISRQLSARHDWQINYNSDLRKRLVWNATAYGQIYQKSENNSIALNTKASWVCNPKWRFSANLGWNAQFNDLTPSGSYNSEWLFRQNNQSAIYSGLQANWQTTRRLSAWAGIGFTRNYESNVKSVVLKADKSLEPVPVDPGAASITNRLSWVGGLQWQFADMNLLRFSFNTYPLQEQFNKQGGANYFYNNTAELSFRYAVGR